MSDKPQNTRLPFPLPHQVVILTQFEVESCFFFRDVCYWLVRWVWLNRGYNPWIAASKQPNNSRRKWRPCAHFVCFQVFLDFKYWRKTTNLTFTINAWSINQVGDGKAHLTFVFPFFSYSLCVFHYNQLGCRQLQRSIAVPTSATCVSLGRLQRLVSCTHTVYPLLSSKLIAVRGWNSLIP